MAANLGRTITLGWGSHPVAVARIVLLSADGVGTNAIMAATGKAKTCVWRW